MPDLASLTDYDISGNPTGTQSMVAVPTNTNSSLMGVYNGISSTAKKISDFDQKFTNDVLSLPKNVINHPEVVKNVVDKLIGANGQDRYQLWPEKVAKEGLSTAGDVLVGKTPQWEVDPVTGDVHTNQQMIEGAQAMSALAGSGGLSGITDATLGATPFLRPALKYKDRLYKGKEGQSHYDVVPDALYPEFQKMAMSGDDISHYNFGFVNDKGQFLNRDKALEYGINTGLVNPAAGKFGALTSTLLADSSKPGTAIESLAKTKPLKTLETVDGGNILDYKSAFNHVHSILENEGFQQVGASNSSSSTYWAKPDSDKVLRIADHPVGRTGKTPDVDMRLSSGNDTVINKWYDDLEGDIVEHNNETVIKHVPDELRNIVKSNIDKYNMLTADSSKYKFTPVDYTPDFK